MSKKATITILLILTFTLFTGTLNVFAGSGWLPLTDKTVTYADSEVQETSSRIVTITKPVKDDVTTSRSYILCGCTDYTKVEVELYIYDSSQEVYRPYTTINDESRWTIGASGFYSKEIELPNKGANKLMIIARADGRETQVSLFKVIYKDEGFKGMIKNGISNIINKISDMIFPK